MRRSFARPVLLLSLLTATLHGQGTKLWTVGRYDEMERGTTDGAAIRGDGRIEPGPATRLLAATEAKYVWAVAPGPKGEAFAAVGGTTEGAAAVLRITAEGKVTKLFSGKELAVQALKTAPDGALYFATSPDGKVYRVGPAAEGSSIVFDPATTAEKPKYIWDLAIVGNSVYVATGAPATVYRIDPDVQPTLAFKTADQHIRCLAASSNGTLWAGSDGAGVVYKFDTTKPAAKVFAAYAAPRKEITALALDSDGSVYVAGVGVKGSTPLPPLPVTGALGVSVTFIAPGSASAVGANTLIPEGSELFTIAPDGAPSHLLTLKDDVVYALTMRNGALIAATGNRGRIYRLDVHNPGSSEEMLTDLAHPEAGQATSFAPTNDGILVGASNGGKIFHLADKLAPRATYTSEVFDTKGFARFGRSEVLAGSHGFLLYLRTGNVPNPLEGWTDWAKISPGVEPVGFEQARFAQWKAELASDGSLDGVGFNYLTRNVAPVVDDVYVQPGARVAISPSNAANNTVQVQFPVPAALPTTLDSLATPIAGVKDKNAVTVRWTAHDDNGDSLMFSVLYRGDGETEWRLLKDKLSDRVFSFDSSLLPDGIYRVKVLASDAPSHVDSDTLTSERLSGEFTLDATAPVPGVLRATLTNGSVHATFEAHDALSPIVRAEYSLDAGEWQYLEPVGKLSDSQTERYEFDLPIVASRPSTQHVLAVRVYDRFDNAVSAKTVVR